jgi:hypothetical protein
VSVAGFHRDAQHATGRHRVAGVCGQVEQDLVDLDPVGEDARHLGVRVEPNGDVLSNQTAQQSHRFARNLGQIESRWVYLSSTAERKQPLRELSGALGGMLDLDNVLPPTIVRRVLREMELGEPPDGRQQIVEVVGYSARQLPDGLHPGRMPHPRCEFELAVPGRASRVLEGTMLGYVAHDHELSRQVSRAIADAGHPNAQPALWLRLPRPREDLNLPVDGSPADRNELCGLEHHLVEDLPRSFFVDPEQSSCRGVEGDDSPVRIQHEHGIGQRVNERRPGPRNDVV